MIGGTAVPTIIAETKILLVAVPKTLVGTAVQTLTVGTTIAGTKIIFGSCYNNFCRNSCFK